MFQVSSKAGDEAEFPTDNFSTNPVSYLMMLINKW